MHRWFGLAEPPVLTRVAFGAILLYPVDRREAGYRLLQQYLDHVELDPVGSTDFMYQINRPRDATTEVVGLRINRLSRWSVASFVPALLHVSSDGIGPVAQQAAQYACGLQLDVNTVPDYRGPLAQDQLRPIFTELVRLGMEIVEMGDVP
ncbi:MAG: hypothetical protein ISS49_15895 [Anaerolineae bacterium]|nr:hypothetical protein [Anaerolineae bacterium]